MKTILLILALSASPVYAGGPVVVEDAYEAEPQGKAAWVVPVAILLLIAAAASGGSKGSGNCNGPDDVPPQDGGC